MAYSSDFLVASRRESHFPRSILGTDQRSVKLMVINRRAGTLSSDTFSSLPGYLNKGDLLVANNSSVVNSSFNAYFTDLEGYGRINVGTTSSGELKLVEPRPMLLNKKLNGTSTVELIGTGRKVELVRRDNEFRRYWWADFKLGNEELRNLLDGFGGPVSYDHLHAPVSAEDYRSVFSRVPGSVEPPSAALPFTDDTLMDLRDKGIGLAEVTLHCNLGSLEPFEFEGKNRLLQEEYMIPEDTMDKIVATKENGGRVIAVGTTVVRALESAAAEHVGLKDLQKHSRENGGVNSVTDLYIRRGFGLEVVDGIITGMHEGDSSHLDMMSSFAGPDIFETAYSVASDLGYLWHEFGDSTLIL